MSEKSDTEKENNSPEEEYEKRMFSGVESGKGESHDMRKDALTRAHDIRKFEIELYWKRALYFWGFQIVLMAAFALAVSKKEGGDIVLFLAMLLSVMGMFISVAWYFMSKGGKAWQGNWERHIDFLEDDYEGRLHKTVIGKKEKFYSVSRINQYVIGAWGLFWLIVLLSILCLYAERFDYSEWWWCFVAIPVVILLMICLVVILLSNLWRTKFDESDNHIYTREKKLK